MSTLIPDHWPTPWVDAEEWPPREQTPEWMRDLIHALEQPVMREAEEHAEKAAAWLKPHSQRAYAAAHNKELDRYLARRAALS